MHGVFVEEPWVYRYAGAAHAEPGRVYVRVRLAVRRAPDLLEVQPIGVGDPRQLVGQGYVHVPVDALENLLCLSGLQRAQGHHAGLGHQAVEVPGELRAPRAYSRHYRGIMLLYVQHGPPRGYPLRTVRDQDVDVRPAPHAAGRGARQAAGRPDGHRRLDHYGVPIAGVEHGRAHGVLQVIQHDAAR